MRLRVEVPAAVAQLLTAQVALEIAEPFTNQPVYPGRIVVDVPDDPSRRFPGWPGPVLVLCDENQGVCSWGVPLGDDRSPVLVGGDLLDSGRTTVRYAASVAEFIAARRWDRACLQGAPLLQAQAAELDPDSLAYLMRRLTPAAVTTAGWPGPAQHRFEDAGLRVLLWDYAGQCDWWVSASSGSRLKAFAAELMNLSDLRSSLWSNDEAGERLLADLRVPEGPG